MADLNKFEQMLELLVNENKEAAQELFHEIVVEKSRDIYESLLEDEADIEEETDEVDESEEEEVEEGFSLDEFEVEADDDMGGDPTDDMMSDLGMDDEEDDMDDEGEEDDEMEDRVEDLEDALDELKAEFEKMMAGDDEGDAEDDMDAEEESFAFEADDEEVEEATDEVEEATDEVEETAKSAGETMREYVEKVSATMGDNGANTKSAVAGPNDMGGDASNLAQSADEKGATADAPKEDDAGNVNVPGGKASKSMTAAKAPAKGGDAANTKPVIGK
jgi:hypothetical protein